MRQRIYIFTVWLFCTSMPALADIDLELRPPTQTVSVDDVVSIGLYAVSDDDTNQSMVSAQVIFSWDNSFLQLLGLDDSGAVPLLISGFLNDPFDINEEIPPQDGDGMYAAVVPFNTTVEVTPEGVLLTTFQFLALADTAETPVDILETGGPDPENQGATEVLGPLPPNVNVTGTLTGAVVTIGSDSCTSCASDAECNDGNACTIDNCGAEGCCETTPTAVGTPCSDDGNECTDDECDGNGSCSHPNASDGAACMGNGDGECSGADSCLGGSCTDNDVDAGSACGDDGNECTDDVCDGSGTCTHPDEPDGTPCSGNGAGDCTAADTCLAGACADNDAAAGSACADDANNCTDDICNGSTTCTHPVLPDGTACDDGDACTGNDTCSAGSCSGTPGCVTDDECEDGNVCTIDACEADGCCANTPVAQGTPCPGDDNECTDDVCDEAGACIHPDGAEGAPCDDGNACTQDDTCMSGLCEGGPSVCEDSTLILTSDPVVVQAGDEVVVTLSMLNLGAIEAAGFQAYLTFDSDLLNFESGSYTADPFGLHFISPITAVGEDIDLSAGINFIIGQQPTSEDAELVHLTFTAEVDGCVISADFRDSPVTILTTFGGDPIMPLQLIGLLESSDVDDDDPCTVDLCDPDTGEVTHDPIDCSGLDDLCNVGVCDPDNGMCGPAPSNEGGPCDDGDGCTQDDVCASGVCSGTGVDCNDDNPCTSDSCSDGTCQHDSIPACCGNDICESGETQCGCPADCGDPPGTETNCDDGLDNDCDGATDCDDSDCPDSCCCCPSPGECCEVWGDVVGAGGAPNPGSNCDVDLFDVFCELNGFAAASDWPNVCPLGDLVGVPADNCERNGSIDLFDIFASLNAFANPSDPACPVPCPEDEACSDSPPDPPPAQWPSARVGLILNPSISIARPGEEFTVDVYVKRIDDLRGYQLALEVHGGQRGAIKLQRIGIDTERTDYVFDDLALSAVDEVGARLANTMQSGGVTVEGRGYLATFVFRASPDAVGVFQIAVRKQDTQFGDSQGRPIGLRSVPSSQVEIVGRRRGTRD